MKKPGAAKQYTPNSLSDMIRNMADELSGLDDKRFTRFFNYVPIPKLMPYFASAKKTSVMIGANKSTKTTAGVFKAIMIYTGIVPPSMRGVYPHEIPTNRPRHVRIICQDFTKHYPETIRPLLLDDDAWGMLPKAWANYSPEEHMFYGPDGSWLSIMSIDPKKQTDPNELRGPLVDHTYIDEISTRMAYTESLTRGATLQDGPRTVDLGFCPQEGYDWTYEDLYKSCFNPITDQELPEQSQHPDIFVVRVGMRDNPSISREEIGKFISSLKVWEIGYRVNGMYTVRAGDPYFNIPQIEGWRKLLRQEAPYYECEEVEADTESGDFTGKLVKINGYPDDDQVAWKVWEMPKDGERYIASVDTAEGNILSDYNVCDIWKVTDPKYPVQVAQLRRRLIKPGAFSIQVCCMANVYGDCLIAVEINNTSGGTVRDRMRNYPNLYRRIRGTKEITQDTEQIGWYTDQYSKPAALEDAFTLLQAWQAKDHRGFNSLDSLDELLTFQEKIERDPDTNIAKRVWGAVKGAHDDTVTTLYIMAYIVKNQFEVLTKCKIVTTSPEQEYQSSLEAKAAKNELSTRNVMPGLKKQPKLVDLMKRRSHAR